MADELLLFGKILQYRFLFFFWLGISLSTVVYSKFKVPRFSPWLTVNQADNSCISKGLAVSMVESGRLIQGW